MYMMPLLLSNIGNPVSILLVTYEEDTANSYYALVVDPDEGTESAPSNWEARTELIYSPYKVEPFKTLACNSILKWSTT